MDKGKQMRFTEDELKLLKATFEGNDPLLKLLRKIFLPEYDPAAPLGQAVDLWMTVDVRQLSAEEAYLRLLARNELIMHVESMLVHINNLAGMKAETEEERATRMKKDSAK